MRYRYLLPLSLLSAVHCVNKCKNAWFYIQWSWPIFFYFYWKLQKHSTWDNVLENLIQQLVFLPREILQCGGRKSILMKLLVCLCLQIQTKAVASDRLKLQTSGRLATISIYFITSIKTLHNIQIQLRWRRPFKTLSSIRPPFNHLIFSSIV